MSDAYERMGEFHDLFMDSAWERLMPTMARAFGGLPDDAVIIDVGAGSGVGTRLLARASRARIVAVEPSLTMRSVLLARVTDDVEVSRRVTVIAGSAPDVFADIDGPIDGFVCAHVLGHVGPAARAKTWAVLAERLGPDGAGMIVVNADTQSDDREVATDERTIGRHRYVARHLPGDAGNYVSEYSVYEDDRVVRREQFAGTWQPITLNQLEGELTPAGLTVEEAAPGVGLVRRSSRA